MTAYDYLSQVSAAAGASAFLYRLPELTRRRDDPAVWALCVYFLASALSFLIDLNVLRNHIAAFFNYPNVTTVITQSAVVILTAAQQVVLIYWSHPPEVARARVKRCISFFLTMLMVLVSLFFLIGPYNAPSSAEDSLLRNMGELEYALYLLFYITICAVGQFVALRMSWRHTGVAHRFWLRLGMRAVTAGAALILVYCLIRYTEMVGTQLGFDMSAWEPVYWLAGSVGSLLQLFGWTVPSWGAAASLWISDYRAYLALRPLWWALYQAVPSIALELPRSPSADRLPPRNLRFHLYRRVIEILDGYLELRPQLSLAARQADHANKERHSPEREARLLHWALTARAEGRETSQPAGTTPIVTTITRREDGFTEQLAWLIDVALSFTRITADHERRSALRNCGGTQ
ncbi:hypothetical protein IPZ58_31055 [Streptomyces roseoverticillatus]|uniref:MAB_1171c family putative transporter n=1 Tax=Streptomyces roseoverticillatus TaxID=66429 RepID=UPI001F3C4389|nr:MAB_1171c family putative transporter [Streptomyces roseoverticillatus]MCF3105980.1 hypothetical protein [Streptomyces roseoverticillatus]